jgi:hypothetical protein
MFYVFILSLISFLSLIVIFFNVDDDPLDSVEDEGLISFSDNTFENNTESINKSSNNSLTDSDEELSNKFNDEDDSSENKVSEDFKDLTSDIDNTPKKTLYEGFVEELDNIRNKSTKKTLYEGFVEELSNIRNKSTKEIITSQDKEDSFSDTTTVNDSIPTTGYFNKPSIIDIEELKTIVDKLHEKAKELENIILSDDSKKDDN